MHWERNHSSNEDSVNKKFDLLHSCLQGVAATEWDLYAAKYEGGKLTEKNFMRCMMDHLEAVAKYPDLGD